jgi:hypothetical protein
MTARALLEKIKYTLFPLDDRTIFALWIGGLTLIGFLAWATTGSLRLSIEMEAVNKVLLEKGDARRLDTPLKTFGLNGKATSAGVWYRTKPAFETASSAGKNGLAVVFSLADTGAFFPVLAFCTEDGLDTLIPLNYDAEVFLAHTSDGFLRVYRDRIETGRALLLGRR